MTPMEGVSLAGAALVLILLVVRPTVGIAALAIYYPLYWVAPRFPVAGMNAETTLVGLGMALTLLRFGVRIPPPQFSLPVIAFVLVLLASWGVAITSVAQGYSDPWDMFKVVKTHAFTSLMFFMGYWWFREPRDRLRLFEALSLGAGFAAASAIVDLVHPYTYNSMLEGRPSGLLENPNALACVLGAFGLVCLYLVGRDDLPRWRRWLHGSIYALCLTGIILTLSRGGWLAFIAGHSLWFLYVNRKVLALGMAALALAATIAFPLLPEMIQERVEQASNVEATVRLQGAGPLTGSAAFRVIMYRIGLEMWMESPLWGKGLDAVKILTPTYGAKYGILKHKTPHSLPLKFIAETGLLGIGVLFALAMVVLVVGRRLWRWSDDPLLGVLLLGVGTTIGTADLFHTNFLHVHTMSAYFWLLLGVCVRKYMVGDDYDYDEEPEALDPELEARGATAPV